MADDLVAETGQDLVAVQTVLVEEHWHELREGLERLGHTVVHVVLDADVDELRRRIAEDRVESTAAAWRLEHLDPYAAARPWLAASADLVLDTTALTPEAAADRVVALVTDEAQARDGSG